jgi:hypothetical protein
LDERKLSTGHAALSKSKITKLLLFDGKVYDMYDESSKD